MTAALSLNIRFDGDDAEAKIQAMADAIRKASELESLAEVRDSLLDLGDFAGELFRVDVEDVAGAAGELRASLQLTDAGRDLAAALGAGNVDLLVVKKALGHLIRSCSVMRAGVDAESGPGETSAPAKPALEDLVLRMSGDLRQLRGRIDGFRASFGRKLL